MRYHSNWLEFIGEKMVINSYTSPRFDTPSTLHDALLRQAKCIYDDHSNENLILLISGGIDSQMMTYGFVKQNIPCKIVHFDMRYEGRKSEAELLFTKQFEIEHGIDVEYITFNFSKQDILLAAKEKDWLNTSSGCGNLLQLMAYDIYSETTDGKFVSSPGSFFFSSEGGFLVNLVNGQVHGIDINRNIPFMYYSQHLINYYEYVHRNHAVYQYYNRFDPKHLAFTELGMFLRPKLGSWECIHDADYSTLTKLDFGNQFSSTLLNYPTRHFFQNEIGIEGQKTHNTEYVMVYSF